MLGRYKNNDALMEFECEFCGHKWITTYTHICNHDTGCPLEQLRKNEKTTGQILKQWQQKKKIAALIHHDKLRKKDFPSMPNKKFIEPDFTFIYREQIHIVEYHGIQHYEAVARFGGKKRLRKQRKRDKWLRELCHSKNWIYVEIDGRSVTGRKKIEEFLRGAIFSEI